MPRRMWVGGGTIEALRIYNNGGSFMEGRIREEWVTRKSGPKEIRVPFGKGGGILESGRWGRMAVGR